MVTFMQFSLPKDVLDELGKLELSFVFQPIFYPDGKRIYAREALMRPQGMNVLELIDEYTKHNKLHILELATFFGAVQEYVTREYKEKISINSFPSECFSEEEDNAFESYFGECRGKGIIEVLEYPVFSESNWQKKKEILLRKKLAISLDDYGAGVNDMEKVDYINPDIVKLDRRLVSGIDTDFDKQHYCKFLVEEFHKKGKLVVAEGVETKEEFDYLVLIGTDLFQGYYLAKPE